MVSSHPEQGWSLLCNGVVLFDDDGELLPDGSAVADHHTWLAPALAGSLTPRLAPPAARATRLELGSR